MVSPLLLENLLYGAIEHRCSQGPVKVIDAFAKIGVAVRHGGGHCGGDREVHKMLEYNISDAPVVWRRHSQDRVDDSE